MDMSDVGQQPKEGETTRVHADFEIVFGKPELNRQALEARERAAQLDRTNRAIKAALQQQASGASKRSWRLPKDGPRPKIERVPGTSALRWLAWLFPKKTVERVFEPLIADDQAEYVEAVASGRAYFARWLHVRCHAYVILAGLQIVLSSAIGSLIGWLMKGVK